MFHTRLRSRENQFSKFIGYIMNLANYRHGMSNDQRRIILRAKISQKRGIKFKAPFSRKWSLNLFCQELTYYAI